MENKKKYRHEFKYMLNKGWYEILRQRVKAVMKPDSHGNNGIYRITSLYLDDVFDSAYNDKLMGLEKKVPHKVLQPVSRIYPSGDQGKEGRDGVEALSENDLRRL